jgi:tetratricopeptide (TPR) repeat protein
MQVARDDVSDLHAPPHVASQSDWNRGLATRDEAYRLSARGSYGPARLAFHEVASLGMSKTVALRAVARAREAALLLRMGELGASIRAATDLAETPGVDMALSVSARRTRALARASKGDLGAALGELHGLPTDMLECAESVAWAVRCARVLGPLGEDEEAGLGEELAVAAARAEVIAGATPPWFRILFWGLRAWHLASRPEQIEEAIALQREALALAEREAELLAPEAGTLLAKLLCRLGAHEEAVRLVDRLEPVARREQILREVMRVTAVRWMASVRRGGDAAREESELLAAFHESGSLPAALRISRSVGEELARLGAADKAVRVLELALSYAEEIPWPEEQGRCLEALGRWDEASSLYARWGLTIRASLLVVRRGSGRF